MRKPEPRIGCKTETRCSFLGDEGRGKLAQRDHLVSGVKKTETRVDTRILFHRRCLSGGITQEVIAVAYYLLKAF